MERNRATWLPGLKYLCTKLCQLMAYQEEQLMMLTQSLVERPDYMSRTIRWLKKVNQWFLHPGLGPPYLDYDTQDARIALIDTKEVQSVRQNKQQLVRHNQSSLLSISITTNYRTWLVYIVQTDCHTLQVFPHSSFPLNIDSVIQIRVCMG